MTNREHMMKQIEKMSDEEFCAFLENHDKPWCYGKTCKDNMHCTDCRKKWARETYNEPMPELKAGMFVNVRHTFGDYGIGVVTQNIVVYANGGFDWISQITNDVITIYQANCFDGCNDNNIIWKKS